eukprot:XP_001191467.1 PREDICTED: uncharacterized protein LOC755722 [Strongylocentrotus purpuratus]
MKEKEQDREKDRESSPFKYERDDKDHGQPKNKRPPPDLANLERNDDPPSLDHDSNADVEERDVGVEQFSMPKSLISSQLDEKLSQPTSISSHLSEGEQFSMPKSLISQLDEKLSQPTSISSHLSEGEQFSMPKSLISSELDEKLSQPTSISSHLSEGEQFSMPKSLTSQPDKIRVKRVSRRPSNCYKLTRAKGRQYGRELQKLRREVASLKAKRERNTSAGLDGGNADKRGTTPWHIFIPLYDDLKMMLRDFTRVYLPQMTCWSITIAVGYICGRSEF